MRIEAENLKIQGMFGKEYRRLVKKGYMDVSFFDTGCISGKDVQTVGMRVTLVDLNF